jgi:hypothetical protein
VVNRSDYGPGIRLEAIRAHDRVLLRDADVTVADTPDPDAPKVTLRRARHTDPLAVLKRVGTINARESEAGEKLRDAIERSQSSLPGVSRSEVHVAPWDRAAISEQQLKAERHVDSALAALDESVTAAVLWVLNGGRFVAMRNSGMCAIRERLNCCVAVSARWPITSGSC